MKITQNQIRENCKKIHRRNSEAFFKTIEFNKWVNQCIDLARENGSLSIENTNKEE